MTIIDELLILLDDLNETPAFEVPKYFNGPNLQVIFSSLGRLVNRGWAIKKVRRQETYYSISIHGVNELNRTLDAIKKDPTSDWNGRWHLVIFDIPEAKRKLRDSFRLLLKEAGYGILKASVWISPWSKSDFIKRFAKRYNLSDYIFEIETAPEMNSYQSLLLARQCWDWPAIEDNYQTFLTEASRTMRGLEENPLRRFQAKKLVFRYAEVVKADPQLPATIAPNATLARRAYDLYAKIRPYCLEPSPKRQEAS